MEKRIDKPGFGVVGGRIRHVDAALGELCNSSIEKGLPLNATVPSDPVFSGSV